ncbi:hypothetical protein AGABI1DRAFT_126570 [Agaricus bisporus var. burnettii JB137-S8]|uniref:F-box domain-containing protein n=1 Tax=Agaricus bisporus var. burnettii (strain JB137-S8 / ATCC MYA-4627 / FGSC 10392) TaxID=597362 RepID=K5W5Y5_AGABU|nr:uncharacterized protein AGABI1DRAFT_126570 [Agaricus bisporus var. burnettii JB137-S8]EKM82239.1 hypothetical protein AGABI1DRAFT_126570 [Agaricus bisporus var. burnettii JB137-S8]
MLATFSDSSLDNSPIYAVDNETASIRSEMLIIEDLTDNPRAHPRYVDLCRRLNSIQSLIRFVPPELLSIIFQHASPFPYCVFAQNREERRLFHLVLRSVSHRWYNVVQSTPGLWNCVSLSSRQTNEKSCEQYLELCLDNSGDLPLAIDFGRHREQTQGTTCPLSPTLENIITSNAHRVQSLRLCHLPAQWVASVLPKMSQLSALEVRWYLSSPNLCLQFSSTNLHRLFIFGPFRPVHIELPTVSSITHLTFSRIPIDVCMHFFIECQNLVEFHSISPLHPIRNTVPTITQLPLVHKHLTKLTWHLLDSSRLAHWTNLLLKHINLPALESLTWSNMSNSDQFLNATSFFQRLPKSLNEINFKGMYREVNISTPIWLDYTRHDADLKLLRVKDCTESFLDKVFHKLFRKVTSSDKLVLPFPKLTRCEILMKMEDGRNQKMSSKIGEDLVQLLEERIGLIDSFVFWTSGYDLDWNKEIWLQLKKIHDGSLSLIIEESGKCVDISAKCNLP